MKSRYHLLLLFTLIAFYCGNLQGAEIADFLRPIPVVDVQISPDGQHLAMLRREVKDTLYIVRRADNKIVNGVSSSSGQRFHAFAWANDTRILIEPAVEVLGEGSALPTGSILGFSIDGQKNGYLRRSNQADGADMYSIVNVLIDDPEHVLVARYRFAPAAQTPKQYVREQDAIGLTTQVLATQATETGYRRAPCDDGCTASAAPTLEKLNIYTGKATTIVAAPSGQGEFVTDANGKRIIFTGIDSGVVSIFQSDQISGWQEITYFTRYFDLGATPIGFDASGDVMALDNLVDTLGISVLKEDGEVDSVFRDQVADIDELVRSRDGTLLAASFVAGWPSWYYHQPDSAFASTHEALRAAYPNSDVAVTSFTDDQTEALIRVYSDRNPGTYYVVNLQTRRAEDLLRQIDWMEDEELVSTRPVQIPTRDEFEIYGYLTLPKNGTDTPPVIIMTHQHPFTDHFQWGYDAKAQMFANAGYAVLQINTRGAPGYGQRYTTGSDVEIDNWTDRDLVDALKWVGEQEFVDPSRACLFGSGRGAYSALITAIRNPDEFRCVVAADGKFDRSAFHGTTNPAQLFAASLLQNRDVEDTPWSENISERASRLRTPTLIVSEDKLPPTEQLITKTRSEFVQHVLGVTNLNRVSESDALVATYKRVLAFISGSFATDLSSKGFDKALYELLTQEERQDLQKILSKVYQDIKRATRDRDSRNLPTGLERRAGNSEEKIRRAKRAIRGRDKEVRKLLREEYWQAYESFQKRYEQQVTQSIERGKDVPQFIVPGTAGR